MRKRKKYQFEHLFRLSIPLFIFLSWTVNIDARPVEPDDSWKVHVSANGHFPGAPGIRVLWWWNTGAPEWTHTDIIRCDSFYPDTAPGASKPIQCRTIITRQRDQQGSDYDGTYYDTSIMDGRYYWYKVRVCDNSSCVESTRTSYDLGNGESSHINGAWIGAEPVAPYVPTGVTVSKISEYSVKISWTGSDPRMTDYFQFYRCEDAGMASCEHIRTYDAYTGKYYDIAFNAFSTNYGSTSFPGTNYYYRVKACAQGFKSDESSIKCSAFSNYGYFSATSPPPPDPPQALSASDDYFHYIKITWNPVQDAYYYQLYRDGTLIASINGTSYLDSKGPDLVTGVTYNYTVSACHSTACSEMSNSDSGHLNVQLGGMPLQYVFLILLLNQSQD